MNTIAITQQKIEPTQKIKKLWEKHKYTIISTGLHLLLLLIFFNIAVVRFERNTPIFVTKIITHQEMKMVKKVEPIIEKTEPRTAAGSPGLEGLKGGGISSPKLQERFMVQKQTFKDFKENFKAPMANIQTRIKDMIVPKTPIAVRDVKVQRFTVGQNVAPVNINAPVGAAVSQSVSNVASGKKTAPGISVPGNDGATGRPGGRSDGTGIGNDAGGTTGIGGSGIGFLFGSGTGAGSKGSGPGAGSSGSGGGISGSGTGPGIGPGSGIGGVGSGIIGSPSASLEPVGGSNISIPKPPSSPTGPAQPTIVSPPGPDNPVTQLVVSVETAGEAGFTLAFYMVYPEEKLLIPDAKYVTERAINVGPYGVSPEQFRFRIYVTANDWGLQRGVPRNYNLYSDDPNQVRVRNLGTFEGTQTIIYYFEDVPVDIIRQNRDMFAPKEPDYDDAIITIRFIGQKSR